MNTTSEQSGKPQAHTPEALDRFAELHRPTWELARESAKPPAVSTRPETSTEVVDDELDPVVPSSSSRAVFIGATIAAALGIIGLLVYMTSTAPAPTDMRLAPPEPMIPPPGPVVGPAPAPSPPVEPPPAAPPVAEPPPPPAAPPVAEPPPPPAAPPVAEPPPPPAAPPVAEPPTPRTTAPRTAPDRATPARPRATTPARPRAPAKRAGSFVEQNPY